MNIWVDADACPGIVKDILFRAAERTGIPLTLVANHHLRIPATKNIRFIQVPGGFDVADDEIMGRLSKGDLVITADIPLAADVIAKGAQALNPRGEMYTKENIRGRLNMRDFMDSFRASGIQTGGPPPLNQRDRQNFANHLDRILQRYAARQARSVTKDS